MEGNLLHSSFHITPGSVFSLLHHRHLEIGRYIQPIYNLAVGIINLSKTFFFSFW